MHDAAVAVDALGVVRDQLQRLPGQLVAAHAQKPLHGVTVVAPEPPHILRDPGGNGPAVFLRVHGEPVRMHLHPVPGPGDGRVRHLQAAQPEHVLQPGLLLRQEITGAGKQGQVGVRFLRAVDRPGHEEGQLLLPPGRQRQAVMEGHGHALSGGALGAEMLPHLRPVGPAAAADGRKPGVQRIPCAEGGRLFVVLALIGAVLAEMAVQGEPGRVQLRAGQQLRLHMAGMIAAVHQPVADHQARRAIRGDLPAADGHGGMPQPARVLELIAPGLGGEAVGHNPGIHVLRVQVMEAEPEAVQNLDGLHPQPAHFPLAVMAEVGEQAIRGADELGALAGTDALGGNRVGRDRHGVHICTTPA